MGCLTHTRCSRLHGHNYVVTIHLKSETLSETGFVRDYHDLKFVKNTSNENLDHRNLNDILNPLNSSAENLAKLLYDVFKPQFPELYADRGDDENAQTNAIYEP